LGHLNREENLILAHVDPHGMITVLIAHDPSLVRLDRSTPLCDAPDLWVLGTVADHLGVIPAVHILQPDVLVLDSMRLSLSALEVTQQVTARGVHTHVVIVSMHAEQTSLIRALRSGVAGVVCRPFDRTELIHAVREAANGRHYLSPRLWHTLEWYAERMRNTATANARLTAVERWILELVAAGPQGHQNQRAVVSDPNCGGGPLQNADAEIRPAYTHGPRRLRTASARCCRPAAHSGNTPRFALNRNGAHAAPVRRRPR